MSFQHLAKVGGEAAQVLVSLLDLGLETPPEVVAKELLLVGKVDDALLHPRELGGQELLELGALRVDLRVGSRKSIVHIRNHSGDARFTFIIRWGASLVREDGPQ